MLEPKVRIPKRYVDGLRQLAEAEVSTTDKLVSVFVDAPPASSAEKLVSILSENLSENIFDIGELVVMFVSLKATGNRLNFSSKEMAQSVKAELSSTALHDLSEAQRDNLQKTLELVLDSNSIKFASKAVSVLMDYDRAFDSARILSDVRPIFDLVESEPMALAISHTLKIAFHEQDVQKCFYVVLDSKNLVQLKETIDRAIQKEGTLRDTLDPIQIPVLSE